MKHFILALLLLSHAVFSQNQVDSIDYFIKQYNYQKALELIEQTDIADNLYKKGTILKNLNQYQEAIICFNQLLENNPADVQILVELASCFESLNNYKASQTLLIKALEFQPNNLFLIQKLGNAYYQNENFNKAIDLYLQAENYGETYFLSKQIARCYERLDSIDMSITYYTKALEFNQFDAQTTLRLANIYRKLGETVNGLFLTEQYLKNDSTNTKVLAINALFHYLYNKFPEAVYKFERCLELNDTSYFVIKNLGYSYFKNKNFDSAKTYLEMAFKRDSTNAELCYMTGMACAYSVYKKQAVEYLSKSIDLLTPSPLLLSGIYTEMGKAYTGDYQYKNALNAYLKALELNPNDTILVFTIASHYDSWINDPKKALDYYQKFMDTSPEQKNKALPKLIKDGLVVSYYEFVERRIKEIKKDSFWTKE